jgi:hypothetical protein
MPLGDHEQEHNAANYGGDEPAQQRAATQPHLPPSATPPQPPQPPHSDNPPHDKPTKWRENTKLAFEAVGLTVLIAYTIFSCLQWLQLRWTNRLTREALDSSNISLQQTLAKMQGQIDATTELYREAQKQTKTFGVLAANSVKQSEAAKRSADTAHAALIQSQRPWIGPNADLPLITGPITIDSKGHIQTMVKMTTENFGNFAANNVFPVAELFVAQDITLIHQFEDIVCGESTQNPQLGHILFPGQKTIRSGGWPAWARAPITNEKMTPNDQYQPFLLTCIGYRDQFGVPHHTGTIFRPVVPGTGEIGDALLITLDPNQIIPVEWREWYSSLE